MYKNSGSMLASTYINVGEIYNFWRYIKYFDTPPLFFTDEIFVGFSNILLK